MNVTKIWNYVIPVFYINVIHHLKRGLTLTIKANGKFGVLETDDKLYYVIWDVEPEVIKEKAIEHAEKLNEMLKK